MKLVLQIAFGVFLGSLGSGLVIDYVQAYQDRIIKEVEATKLAEEKKARREQGRLIREMLLKGRRKLEASKAKRSDQDSIPNDTQTPIFQDK
ncbi:MAG: hypothetical protein V3V31_16530 [Methylococcales bacterium]